MECVARFAEKVSILGQIRLVPKFGMEAFPDNRTIDSYLRDATLDADRYHQSSTLNFPS